MIELFLEPAKILLTKGLDAFKNSQERKNLSASVQDRIRRECKFNSTVLAEVAKFSEPDMTALKLELLRSLKVKSYEDVNGGGIPLSLLFDGNLTKEDWPKFGDVKLFQSYVKNDTNLVDLLDRTYYRIMLTMTFANCGKPYGQIDYLRYLVAATELELRTKNNVI